GIKAAGTRVYRVPTLVGFLPAKDPTKVGALTPLDSVECKWNNLFRSYPVYPRKSAANSAMTTPATSITRRVSRKASLFTESVIREMTREAMKYGAVNLSQGFPDFAAPEDIKRVAMQAIADDVNQYAITWGAKDFR